VNVVAVRSRTTILLVVGVAAAWSVAVDRMRGMDAGLGTVPGERPPQRSRARLDCVGCSGGLMVVLFVLGVMSLVGASPSSVPQLTRPRGSPSMRMEP
jgi:hypothetical protein